MDISPNIPYSSIHEIEDVKLIRKLVEEENFDVNAFDEYGMTPLHYCNSEEVFHCLISLGANPFLKSKENLLPIDVFSPNMRNKINYVYSSSSDKSLDEISFS